MNGEIELDTILVTKTGKKRAVQIKAQVFYGTEKTEVLTVARFAAGELAENWVN